MPQQRSAGILLYRRSGDGVEVLLGHPGGPYWARKDEGAWMVPKGALEAGEKPIEAALREFAEEVGPVPPGTPVPLRTVRQNGGKLVEVFALEGEFDPAALISNEFELEWPPRSGRMRRFPELDQVEWMAMADARRRILASQLPLLEALESLLAGASGKQEQR
jgi:predicted NUDIX family NTP pyrophosphohydrolase